MRDTREVKCKGKTYLLKRYDDQTVAILDAKGNLLAGWPETWSLMSKSFHDTTHEDWCRAIHELRPWGGKR